MNVIGTNVRTIQVEQAVFASSDRGSMKGYQLVARSPGVNRTIAKTLCRWAPTQVPCDDPETWAINYFPVNDQLVAVTRTVLGGPEYSNRGGTEVVTLILLVREDEFQAYAYNPILVAKTALAVGGLRLPVDRDRERLPLAEIPGQPLVEAPASSFRESESDPEMRMLDKVAAMLRNEQRIAVIGHQNPISAVSRLIPKLSLDDRRKFSFTTGLNPTVRRPFQAHFLPSTDLARQRTLDAQNITRVDWSPI